MNPVSKRPALAVKEKMFNPSGGDEERKKESRFQFVNTLFTKKLLFSYFLFMHSVDLNQ